MQREATSEFRAYFELRPGIDARLVRSFAVPTTTVHFSAILTSVSAEITTAFAFAVLGTALDTMSDAFARRLCGKGVTRPLQ